jgi:eukaryotic-like serine/threonine-protein kinase
MMPGREGADDAGDDGTRAWRSSLAPTRRPGVPTAQETPPPGGDPSGDETTALSAQPDTGGGRLTAPTDLESTEREPGAAPLGSGLGAEIEPGRVVFGKYAVVRPLGKGGMGAVWLVRHQGLEAERALKVIIPQVAVDPQMQARFRREARAMARFMHPNAVVVHDADIRPGGAAFIEMEYVRGESLNKLLTPDAPMGLSWTARILEQLCDVLQVAHEHGIVHRDLKPSNLMLLDGQPPGREHLKVLDFGIAKILGAEDRDADGDAGPEAVAGAAGVVDGEEMITIPGLPVGTPHYMSPEQIDARPEGVDGRSDIYAVGVILYEFLTGTTPFQGSTLRVIADHMNAPPPPFAERNPEARVPPEVERLVLRCLEKDPARRPQTARELAEEFRRLALPETEPISPPKPPPAPRWRRPLAVASLVVLALLLLASSLRTRTPPLAVRAAPAALRLRAGDSATLSVLATRGRAGGPVRFSAVAVPEGVRVDPDPSSRGGGDEAQFLVAADLNIVAGMGPQALTIRAEAGGLRRTVDVPLSVEPPAVALPAHFVRPQGARLVRVNGRVYPVRIARDFPRIARDFPDGNRVVFLLIEKRRADDPDPFYIMEDKVWNALFAEFAAENPAAVKDSTWTRGAVADGRDLSSADGRVPVMRVSAKEAHAFASWLGGRLPSSRQWDKAAGLAPEDHPGRVGPFEGEWDPSDPGRIAVDREEEGPLPVGRASRDVGPFGCRDMAGNGLEWTRDLLLPTGQTIPPADERAARIILRGRRYSEPSPLTYDEMVAAASKGDAAPYLDADPEIGFRVVIEIGP